MGNTLRGGSLLPRVCRSYRVYIGGGGALLVLAVSIELDL